MKKIIILVIFCLHLNNFVNSEETTETHVAEERLDGFLKPPPDKTFLQKSRPYVKKEEPSFMSKIAGWLFPFSSNSREIPDTVPAETHHQYLPPPPHPSRFAKSQGCNPCNKEPWIPIAANYGKNTLIGFVPPHRTQKSPQHFYQQPPAPFYGPPYNYNAPSQHAPPPVRHNSHGPPKDYFVPPPYPKFPESIKYLPPQPNYNIGKTTNYQAPILIDQAKPPPPGPALSYGPPLSLVTSFKYLPPTTVQQQYLAPPPVSPNNHYQHHQNKQNNQYLPPSVDVVPSIPYNLPQASQKLPVEYLPPIPFPNLSPGPVVPLRNHQNFQTATEVQVIKSIPVANYLHSIEHPINIIQSPIVDVTVREQKPEESEENNGSGYRLSENPIIVEDTHTAASVSNATFEENSNVNKRNNEKDLSQPFRNKGNLLQSFNSYIEPPQEVNRSLFTPPPMDYTDWTPSFINEVSTSMVPPPVGDSPWLSAIGKKTKQIIIPYVTNNTPQELITDYQNKFGKIPPTLSPFTKPPSSEAVWSHYTHEYSGEESNKITQTISLSQTTTPTPSTTNKGIFIKSPIYAHAASNIRDLLKGEVDIHAQGSNNLPFDIITLQKHIDDWTQQEYSNSNKLALEADTPSTSKLPQSKQIPDNYFTTQAVGDSTTIKPEDSNENFFDHFPSSSDTKEDFETNFIVSETTTDNSDLSREIVTAKPSQPSAFMQNTEKPQWEGGLVSISPLTKEKVYVVTPQPWKESEGDSVAYASSSLSIRIPEDEKNKTKESNGTSKVVYSEWPHIINNLQTTTVTSTVPLRHPLFGLMDFPANTPSQNASVTVQTFSGHSKVITVVTAASVTKKKSSGLVDAKKTTAKTTTAETPTTNSEEFDEDY